MFSKNLNNRGSLPIVMLDDFSTRRSHRPVHLLGETLERARKESIVSNSPLPDSKAAG